MVRLPLLGSERCLLRIHAATSAALLTQPPHRALDLALPDTSALDRFAGGDPQRLQRHLKALYAWLAGKSLHTRRSYARAWSDFFDFTGWPRPEDVSAGDVARWKIALTQRELSENSVYQRLSALSSYFDYLTRPESASRAGLVRYNPVRGVGRADLSRHATSKTISWDLFERILRCLPTSPIGQRDRAILLFFAYTGRRRSEVASLRLGDLTFGPTASYHCRTKGGTIRRWELPRICEAAIRSYLAEANRAKDGPGAPVFAHHRDPDAALSPAALQDVFRRAAGRAGIPGSQVSLHQLRHMAAMDLERAGLTTREIQEFLGHTSIATTETYLKKLTGTSRSFEDVLERARDERQSSPS